MNNQECLNFVNEIEARFPVDRWVVEGVHVWPIMRLRMVLDFLYSTANSGSGSRAQRGKWSKAGTALRFLGGNFRYAWLLLKDFRRNSWPTSPVDAVFLGDQVSRIQVQGQWVDRLCDPLIEEFEKRGLKTFHMEPHHRYRTPRARPSLWLQPVFDFLRLKNVLTRNRFQLANYALPEYGKFVGFVHSKNLGLSFPDRGLEVRLRLIRSYADFFKFLLKKLKPRFGFVVSYYGNEGMAFNLACSELNITSVDLQHGHGGEMHVAYGRWAKVPRSGYNVLPRIYWVWSESDAQAIRNWSEKAGGFHRAFMGGNLWLNTWLDGKLPMVEAYDQMFSNVCPQGTSRNILVTLQDWFASPKDLKGVLGAVRAAPPDWQWWFRLHPNMLDKRKDIEDLLQSTGNPRWDVKKSTELPLYALLRRMDIHMTFSSSVVCEAESFRVPSVIFGYFGSEVFQDQLRSGWAVFAEDPQAISNAIETLGRRFRSERADPEFREKTESRIQDFLSHIRGN